MAQLTLKKYMTRQDVMNLVSGGSASWRGGGILNLPNPARYATHGEFNEWVLSQPSGAAPGALITTAQALLFAQFSMGDYYEYSWSGGDGTRYAVLTPPAGKEGYLFRVHTAKLDGYRYNHTFDGQDYWYYYRTPGSSDAVRMYIPLNGGLTDKGTWSSPNTGEAYFTFPANTHVTATGWSYGPTDSNWFQTLGGWWVPPSAAYGVLSGATWSGTERRMPFTEVTKAQYDAFFASAPPKTNSDPNSPDVMPPQEF